MESQEETRKRLRDILDRIGPEIWLIVDGRFLAAAFGDAATVIAAKKFAQENHCVFSYEPGKNHGDGQGSFGRAYIKKIDNNT